MPGYSARWHAEGTPGPGSDEDPVAVSAPGPPPGEIEEEEPEPGLCSGGAPRVRDLPIHGNLARVGT